MAPPQPPPQQPQQPPPRFRAETNLVRVDVYATKDGVPVQDLTADDFEVSEDNAPQKIDSFEHIVVQTGGPQEERSEPTSVTAANALAADPRRRVFVVYLDIEHVSVEGSHNIKEPLIDFMQRVMGADDLVGVMTPDDEPVADHVRPPHEGDRRRPPQELGLGPAGHDHPRRAGEPVCAVFPAATPAKASRPALAEQMIERRRERIVLDSLQDLIRHMGAIREGRTAVITVSDGWKLFQPDPSMTTPRFADARSDSRRPPPVGVGPGGGLTNARQERHGCGPSDRTECEKDRAELAMVDHARLFRDLFGEANRANVSFYPIDPRGLPAFDTPIDNPLPIAADHAQLVGRIETLQTLALNTDGIALVNSNDLTKQIRRMADDLTSYYLMGYYSTNNKLDGKFRAIKVRSKRPGVEVRSRRGYSAATAAEVAKARAAAETVVPEAKAAVTRALGHDRERRARGGPHDDRGPPAIRWCSTAGRPPATRCSPPPGASSRAASASAWRWRPRPARRSGRARCSIATARRRPCRSSPPSAPTPPRASAGSPPTSRSRRSGRATTSSSSRRWNRNRPEDPRCDPGHAVIALNADGEILA